VKLFTDVQQNLSPAVMAVSTLLLAVVVLAVVVGVLVLGARRTIYRVAFGDRVDRALIGHGTEAQ
jgi:hypothetical protein